MSSRILLKIKCSCYGYSDCSFNPLTINSRLFFLNPCACLRHFAILHSLQWHTRRVGAPRAWPQLSLGWVFVALSHRQSQSERRTHNHRLSVSSFVFDWIKLPCLVRVLVSVPLSTSPFSPSVFLVAISAWPGFCFLSMSHCVVHCMLANVRIHSFSCPDSCLLSSPLERVRIQSLAQCLTQSYWSTASGEQDRSAAQIKTTRAHKLNAKPAGESLALYIHICMAYVYVWNMIWKTSSIAKRNI